MPPYNNNSTWDYIQKIHETNKNKDFTLITDDTSKVIARFKDLHQILQDLHNRINIALEDWDEDEFIKLTNEYNPLLKEYTHLKAEMV